MTPEFRLTTPLGDVVSTCVSDQIDRIDARWTARLVDALERTDLRPYEAACYALDWSLAAETAIDDLRLVFVVSGNFADSEPGHEPSWYRSGACWQSDVAELKVWSHDEEWLADTNPDFGFRPDGDGWFAMFPGGFRTGKLSLAASRSLTLRFAIAWTRTDELTAELATIPDWGFPSGHGAFNQTLDNLLSKH